MYEGNSKVKGVKIQTYQRQFEHLKMKEDEDIAAYFHRVDEIVNTMRGLEVKIENLVIVQNIFRSLPMRFESKISSLEEREDIDTLSVDELHGIPIAYKIRT